MSIIKPFKEPIYVTRPLLPNLGVYTEKLQEVWDSRWLSNMGKQHNLLEARLKEKLKTPYISLFNNGTIALVTACQSLRLTGEVITTPFTFAATPHALTCNNIKPVFCDINPDTLVINAAQIEAAITPQTTGILAVHVFGMPCDVVQIQKIADEYGLRVIYDAAHAFETEVNGVGIGTFGDISMFSFQATKLFHTCEGGALTYKDPNLKTRIDLLKNFGIKSEEEVVMPGINGKMNEIQAALGLVLLDYLEEERQKRKKLIDTYRLLLQDIEGVFFPTIPPEIKHSYQYFVVKIDEEKFGCSRDFVYEKLHEYNVFPRKYFFPLCSQYSCYRQLSSASKANLPVANKIVNQVLSLPLYGGLSVSDVEKICLIIKNIQTKDLERSRRKVSFIVSI